MFQARLRICADSQETSLLACTKYGCRRRLIPKLKLLDFLGTSARKFIKGIQAYAISTINSCIGSNEEVRALCNIQVVFVQKIKHVKIIGIKL